MKKIILNILMILSLFGCSPRIAKANGLSSYEDFDFKTIVQAEGDVFSRAVVRLLEVEDMLRELTESDSQPGSN